MDSLLAAKNARQGAYINRPSDGYPLAW